MDFILLAIKKILALLVLPLPFALFLAVIGLLIVWFSSRLILGLTLITIAVIILGLLSMEIISHNLLLGLEASYPPLLNAPPQIKTIVVLGGGNGSANGFPANTRVGAASLSRLIEGIRLYRQLAHQSSDVKLILSGGRVFRSYPEGGRLKNTAVTLGVDPSHILVENGSQNTSQEALYLKPLLGTKPFILVTSAYHMKRAIAIFKKQGMNPIAAPTQFLSQINHDPLKSYLPNSTSLVGSDIAIHEYLGLWWARFRNAA